MFCGEVAVFPNTLPQTSTPVSGWGWFGVAQHLFITAFGGVDLSFAGRVCVQVGDEPYAFPSRRASSMGYPLWELGCHIAPAAVRLHSCISTDI